MKIDKYHTCECKYRDNFVNQKGPHDRWHDAWLNGFPAKRLKNEETIFEEA